MLFQEPEPCQQCTVRSVVVVVEIAEDRGCMPCRDPGVNRSTAPGRGGLVEQRSSVFGVAVGECGAGFDDRGVQGFGLARSQKWVYDPIWGKGFANRLYTARPPGILDVPLDMDWVAAEIPDPYSPVGAKGIGEPPIVGIAPAIANALAEATGVRLRRLPMTPERVLRALNEPG